MREYPSDIAFTPAVKAVQTAKGSRDGYARAERRGWRTRVTPDLAVFLAGLDMFYLGTAVNRHLKQGHFDRKEGPPCGFPAANAGVEVFGQGRRCERQAVGRLLVGVHGVRQALISRLRVVDASLLAGR